MFQTSLYRMQCLVFYFNFFAHLSPILLQATKPFYLDSNGRRCTLCPAGAFQKSCTECMPCPAGTYTTKQNRESSCHRCYRDCKPEYHMKVVDECTSTSDLKCACQAGYRCQDRVSLSTNCRYCVKVDETTSTEAAMVISTKDKHTPSSASSGRSSTSANSCRSPLCGPQSVPQAGNSTHIQTDKTDSHLVAILCPIVVIGFLALVILLFIRCHEEESCLKQAMSKLYNEGGQDASHKPKEPTHQLPRDSFSAKQQSSSLSAGNLGPVHVHNPGTVIVSLLNQFTGQVGPTVEGAKTVERGTSEEEQERDCPVCHPTSSTSVHLSEEERSAEIDSMFLPSQEQGKDCHVSKEEVL
ncbi:tumor necrosis factor receptor superfamily member 5 [Cheilinus undulatus]|uniref:tumor necrosis factor receptor superfamily member 5 n=1 Tax=Cheilinus undulatus TaxID=241271 RepID=UPI001BD63E4D|nr:tumor necrosis factor receptor superfamily member 5 [Cheilinus undulatus]XP_041648868.1 tumor necrosis factor receptor superfamily member 5 [Cheilinus undulatus]